MALPSLSPPLSPPPLMRVASLGFWIWLGGRHRGARVPRTDIKRHVNLAMFHAFLGSEFFGVVVSLIAAKKMPWQFHCAPPYSTGLITKRPEKSPRLTARGTQGNPARPSTPAPPPSLHDRHRQRQLYRRHRRIIYACTGTRVSEIIKRADGRQQLGLWSLVSRASTKAILKLRCAAFQRATSELHRVPLSAFADTAKSVVLPALPCRFCPSPKCQRKVAPRILPPMPTQRSSLRQKPRATPGNAKLLATAANAGTSGSSLGGETAPALAGSAARRLCGSPALRLAGSAARLLCGGARRLCGGARRLCGARQLCGARRLCGASQLCGARQLCGASRLCGAAGSAEPAG